MNEKQIFLSKIDLFKDLTPYALERLAAETNLVYFPEAHLIRNTARCQTDDSSDIDGLYIIKSGAAKVTTASESGEVEAVIAILKKGNWFGEIGLIDGLPPSANVVSMNTMECFFLPRRAFLAALKENPEIAVSMLPGLGNMVRSADQWISQLL
ncbi:MAG: cyclic nucleotide-binding domain-containing protein [Chloroflexi bacterium]|nr:cyclic nucleotide-binding domain-containing protein [Chloroflexota bacterium]